MHGTHTKSIWTPDRELDGHTVLKQMLLKERAVSGVCCVGICAH